MPPLFFARENLRGKIMKKKFIITILALIAATLSALTFTACNGFGGSGSDSENTGNGNTVEEKPEFSDGNGSEETPYVISQPYQLLNVSKHLDGYFELAANLNMGDSGTLAAIGTVAAPFTGAFDGKGYTIHSASISAKENSGLFGVISGATITNLTFKDSYVSIPSTETRNMGSFVGSAKMGAQIENCHVENIQLSATKRTVSENFYVGGFIGKLSSASKIIYCSAKTVISINSWNFKTGGFIGMIDGGAIDACSCAGTINVDGLGTIAMVGGFAAYISGGEVSNVLAAMNIKADGNVGGIAYSLSGNLSYAVSVCDIISANKKNSTVYSATVDYTNCVAFSSSEIDTANSLLDSEDWKDNAIWQKGTLYPVLVSYDAYVAATRHINVIA